MDKTHKISVIVVTHNARRYIVPCLRSVLDSRGVIVDRVVVVDNASSDDTVDLVERHFSSDPRVKVVRLRRNVGYPLACNIGVTHVGTEFVVLMNPDVVVDPYCFANLASYMSRDEKIAVAQPKILHPGGYIDSAGGLMDLLGHGFHIGKFERDHGQYDSPRDILYACFACAMVRRGVYLRLGGMDSRYFLYNEDLDFCWRCWLASYHVAYVPSAVAYHVGQHATRRVPYHAIYFGRRNRLFTIFTNYSLPLGMLSSVLLASLYAVLIPYAAARGDRVESRIMIDVLVSVVGHLRYLVRRRALTSSFRRVGDFELVRRGLITLRLVGLVLFMGKLYRRLLGIT